MREFISLVKALSDENRVRALLVLRNRELCACQIVELIQLAPSTVSKHMQILRQAGLVEARKDGRWMYYRLAKKGIPAAVAGAIDWIFNSLKKDQSVLEDEERIKGILKLDPDQLCKILYQKG